MMDLRFLGHPMLRQKPLILGAASGFTLVEAMLVVAILGILLTIAIPSFATHFERYRARRAAETLNAFLVNAKSEAIKRNSRVRAVFKASGTDWCAGLIVVPASAPNTTCDCIAGTCLIDGASRTVSSSDFSGVLLNSPANNTAFVFNPQRGTTSSGTVQIESAGGERINIVLSGRGRIMMCAPSSNGMEGYGACP